MPFSLPGISNFTFVFFFFVHNIYFFSCVFVLYTFHTQPMKPKRSGKKNIVRHAQKSTIHNNLKANIVRPIAFGVRVEGAMVMETV